MIKIAIAEDNSFLAQSILAKLALFEDFKVKFHALNGADLLEKLQADNHVDLILMDVQMPEMDGVSCTEIITAKYGHIKVVMLTVMDDMQTIYASLKNGAVGYLLKDSSPQEIHDGIVHALNGKASLSPAIALKTIQLVKSPENIDAPNSDFGLTKREKQVLKQLAFGNNYKAIATNLFISPNTVRRHTDSIYRKLGVNNKVEALQVALKNSLL